MNCSSGLWIEYRETVLTHACVKPNMDAIIDVLALQHRNQSPHIGRVLAAASCWFSSCHLLE